VKVTLQVHWAERIQVVLHPTDYDATILLRLLESGLGGQDGAD